MCYTHRTGEGNATFLGKDYPMKLRFYAVSFILAAGLSTAIPAQAVAYREVTDSLTGATLKIWNEGHCESFRIEETVPSDMDNRKIKLSYDIDTSCTVSKFTGRFENLPVTIYSNDITRSGDQCKTLYTEHYLKDPVGLVVSSLQMRSLMCWNGATSYFSAPRYAKAAAPLSWNHVAKQAYFTSIGDTYGRNARISAVADFKTDFVTCIGKTYSMSNSATSNPNGAYSAGFSHDLRGCIVDTVHAETSHYAR